MKAIKTAMLTAAIAMAMPFALPATAQAQESSYTPGTVWSAQRIKVMPGQFENYMDWLATEWKKIQEFGKSEGWIVDYHVLSTNYAREGEPDLVLVVEYKDYATTAQIAEANKKIGAMLAQSDRAADKANGERAKMREPIGSTEYQELNLN